MRLALLILLSSLGAVAAPRYQLQVAIGAGAVPLGFIQGFPVATSVALGFEDGLSVFELGLGGGYFRSSLQPAFGGLPSPLYSTWSVQIAPGYRRYLSDFGSGFAPFVEAAVQVGVAKSTSSGTGVLFNQGDVVAFGSEATTLLYGGSIAFGGEVRFNDHFAFTGRLLAVFTGTRGAGTSSGAGDPASGTSSVSHTASLGPGSSAGVTLRF